MIEQILLSDNTLLDLSKPDKLLKCIQENPIMPIREEGIQGLLGSIISLLTWYILWEGIERDTRLVELGRRTRWDANL